MTRFNSSNGRVSSVKDAREKINQKLRKVDARSLIANKHRAQVTDARTLLQNRRSSIPVPVNDVGAKAQLQSSLPLPSPWIQQLTKKPLQQSPLRPNFGVPKVTISNNYYSLKQVQRPPSSSVIDNNRLTNYKLPFQKIIGGSVSKVVKRLRPSTVPISASKSINQHAIPFRPQQPFEIQALMSTYHTTMKSDTLLAAAASLKGAKVINSNVKKASLAQGYKVEIRNLHPVVSRADINELFSSVGPLRSCSLLTPGSAEVIFINKADAIKAIQQFNLRELDGIPMQLTLISLGGSLSTTTPTANIQSRNLASRLGDGSTRTFNAFQKVNVDADTITRALFNTTKDITYRRPVNFQVNL